MLNVESSNKIFLYCTHICIFVGNLPVFFILLVVAKLNKIMEAYDVFVSVKPKPKQPSKVN